MSGKGKPARGAHIPRDDDGFAPALDPTESLDAARDRELRGLYGGQSARIKQLEAMVNLRHDASLDKHQPEVWPQMPLDL